MNESVSSSDSRHHAFCCLPLEATVTWQIPRITLASSLDGLHEEAAWMWEQVGWQYYHLFEMMIAGNGEVNDGDCHILEMTCDWDKLEKNDCMTNNWYIGYEFPH